MTLDMKSSLIVIFVLSFSLVGSVTNSYADVGAFVTEIDGLASGDTNFIPVGIAVDNFDNIIITDDWLSSVHIYEYDGSFVTIFDGSEGNGQLFEKPASVAVDSNDRIIVADSDLGIVQIYDIDGNFLGGFDGSNGGTKFVVPSGVAVDSENRIIVSDFALGMVQIYNSNGIFISSFDGSSGTTFDHPVGIAVDSNDRIIVSDNTHDIVQIFSSDGTHILTLDGSGGTEFGNPTGVAVDSENRILVADTLLGMVQIYNSNGIFISSFDGSGGTKFVVPSAIAVDSNDRIIVSDLSNNKVQIFEAFNADENTLTGSAGSDDPNGGCADCTPPTLGLGPFDRERLVDNGFSYNGNSVQVEKWHTPFPLINATVGELNTVEIIVYENEGIYNMQLVQFGLGATEIGQPLNDLEVLIEVWLETFNLTDKIVVEKIIIKDRDNLIDTYSVFAVVDIVKCQANSLDEVCIKVTLEYSYREATINNVMVVNVSDISRNSQNFYFNDGVQVFGESLNEPPTYQLSNKKLKQQTENLYLTLTRTDKVNHIWTDELGAEYLQISEDRFDRLTPHTPMECTDPPLSEISVPTRSNCHFRALTTFWN